MIHSDGGTTMLRHNKIDLALHLLRSGSGRPLLMLHGLGERSPARVPEWVAEWPGPIAALDFTGHGESTLPVGGGYSAEALVGDADIAVAVLGPVTVVGRGLGAWVALMLAGARADMVRGVVLCDGPGLTSAATGPPAPCYTSLPPASRTPDPYALLELSRDVRPPDYATHFVRLALERGGLDEPIAVSAVVRPPWLAAVAAEVGVLEADLPDALNAYAQI